MQQIRRRAFYYVLSISVLIFVSAILYDVGMKTFEPGTYPPPDVEVSIFHSLQVVVETFTATGYGSDSPWKSPEMNLLVMVLDITGVAMFFLALPAIFIPLFRNALSRSPPSALGTETSDHVIICSDTTRAEVLVEELDAHGVPNVLVEPDEDRAIDLDEAGYTVIHGNPESISGLERANVGTARALVADVTDRIDASIVLAAREANENLRIISVVEEAEHMRYHELAGADEVLMPRQLVGDGLADKLTTGVSDELDRVLAGDGDFDVREVPVRHGSELSGATLAESNLGERFGVDVIGVWHRGEFEPTPPADRTLAGGTILLVTGTPAKLADLEREVVSVTHRYRQGKTVVVGYGEVGQTIADRLEDADLPYTVIDREDLEGVDVVGDATEESVLRAAGVDDADGVVLAIPDEVVTEFVTLMVRGMNPSTQVLARADDAEAVRKTYRAGADYVVSLATVSGRSIATTIISSEEMLSVGSIVEVLQTTAPELAGQTLEEAGVRNRTGCTVIAAYRDGELLTDIEPDFRFDADDELVVVGTEAGLNTFVEHYK